MRGTLLTRRDSTGRTSKGGAASFFCDNGRAAGIGQATSMSPKIIHWKPKWGLLGEEAMRQQLMAEGYRVSKYHYPPGTYFPPHTHPVDKKDTVLRGQFKIGWNGGDVLLRPGDMIEIPAGFSHSAEVVGSETVVSLDATRSR